MKQCLLTSRCKVADGKSTLQKGQLLLGCLGTLLAMCGWHCTQDGCYHRGPLFVCGRSCMEIE